jgi:UPF0755 protein
MIEGPHVKRFSIIAAFAAMILILWGIRFIWIPVDRNDATIREIKIEQGQGLYQIADKLKSAGIIRSTYGFIGYVAARGQEEQLQAGRYLFTRAMNIPEITYRLVEGLAESDDLKITIKEGFNIWDIDEEIAKAELATEGDFARMYYNREGKLFPDTYRFKIDTPLKEIYQKLLDTHNKKSGLPDSYTLVTASILEKEAKSPEDMAMVADIIYRRLERGMMLQIDATVGYGWCLRVTLAQNFTRNCDVTQAPIVSEIRRDGEFNTYMRHGLPPRPISNPGAEAIKAARNPISNEYLYYLSTRDGSQIIYAKTGEEHNANRRKYLGL